MNKCILKICIISLLLYFGQIGKAQVQIDTTSVYYYDCFHCTGRYLVSYKIQNNSEESYVTWISHDPIDGKSTREIVFDGILNRHGGDFSFWDLIRETGMIRGVTYTVPMNCMKMIEPGESFTYTIVKSREDSNFYEDRMVLLEMKRVDECFKISNHKMELDLLLYKDASIVLVDS